ncbi:MAG: hypothetical protein ACOWWR_18820 [Eubacteriales bacterium]|jgi:hypothetical protein
MENTKGSVKFYQPASELVEKVIDAIEQNYHLKDSGNEVKVGKNQHKHRDCKFEINCFRKVFFPTNVEIDHIMKRNYRKESIKWVFDRMSYYREKYLKERKTKFALISIRININAIMLNLIAAQSGISFDRLNKGLIKPSDFHKLTEIAGKYYESPSYYAQVADFSFDEIEKETKILMKDTPIEYLFITNNFNLPSKNMSNQQILMLEKFQMLADKLSVTVGLFDCY